MRRHELLEKRNAYPEQQVISKIKGQIERAKSTADLEAAYEMLYQSHVAEGSHMWSEIQGLIARKKYDLKKQGSLNSTEKENARFKIVMTDGESYTIEAPTEDEARKKHGKTVGGAGSKIKSIEHLGK